MRDGPADPLHPTVLYFHMQFFSSNNNHKLVPLNHIKRAKVAHNNEFLRQISEFLHAIEAMTYMMPLVLIEVPQQ